MKIKSAVIKIPFFSKHLITCLATVQIAAREEWPQNVYFEAKNKLSVLVAGLVCTT